MTRFLLEIGSEEIPARMQAAAAAQLAKRFTDACAAAGLAHGTVIADATPRRLWLIAEDMGEASAATAEELKGPRADAPPQAIEGFLKKTGADFPCLSRVWEYLKQAEIRQTSPEQKELYSATADL